MTVPTVLLRCRVRAEHHLMQALVYLNGDTIFPLSPPSIVYSYRLTSVSGGPRQKTSYHTATACKHCPQPSSISIAISAQGEATQSSLNAASSQVNIDKSIWASTLCAMCRLHNTHWPTSCPTSWLPVSITGLEL